VIVLLDSGPLGLVTNPNLSSQAIACNEWLESLLDSGVRIAIPEIADYEVRRELIRAGRVRGLRRLDALSSLIEYLPLTTSKMRMAAEFWADARGRGQPTADDKALHGDMILAAQAELASFDDVEVVIATTNVGHLQRFVSARIWQEIRP
jgi:predicted nucleic acid-binding protein